MGEYFVSLVNEVPYYVYMGLLLIFCAGCLMAFINKVKKPFRYVSTLLLLEYVILIISSTIVFRTADDNIVYVFTPFWSYNRPDLLIENIMNFVMFLPIGILMVCSYGNIKWWKALCGGFLLSTIIEIVQFFTKRGVAEIDDILHNTLGCIIGYGVFSLAKHSYERFSM